MQWPPPGSALDRARPGAPLHDARRKRYHLLDSLLSAFRSVALLGPNIALPVPVDQRAGCLALLHEECVAAEIWGVCFTTFSSRTVFGKNPPGIHPFEVVPTVANGNSGAQNNYLVCRAMKIGRASCRERGASLAADGR